MHTYFSFKKELITVIILLLTLTSTAVLAQEHEEESEKGGHKFTIALGHAHVHEGIENGEKKWLMMTSWAINYDYLISNQWALGIHNDIIFEDFSVEKRAEDKEETALEREKPIATKLVASFKPGKHLSFMLGLGDEFTKSENLFLSTAAVEYGWHMSKGWEVGAELGYDLKWKAYDTWILGFGISKTLHGKAHKKHS